MNAFIVGAIGIAIGAAVGAGICMVVGRSFRKARVLDRRRRALERQDQMRSLAGGLAHEIKNPLSTIGLNAQLLGESIEDLDIEQATKEPLLRRLGTLSREIERLRGILEDFLDYAGGLHLQFVKVDINSVVGELIDFFEPQARTAGVRLRADLSSKPIEVTIDPAHVKQALLNLMLNAVQAMAQNPGDLIIRTEKSTDTDGTHVAIIHVIDTGPGIKPEIQKDLFQPYFTTKTAGSGLGMPTAKRLIEAHGGRIALFSQPGKGTDISVVLPAELLDLDLDAGTQKRPT